MSEPGASTGWAKDAIMSDETEAAGTWLSVSQAAAVMGKSERTVQRRCKSGSLAARLITTDEGQEWQINGATLPTSADKVPTGAAIGADKVPPQFEHENEGAATQHTESVGSVPTGAAIVPPQVPTGADTRVIEILERENAFLKSQIEAANRATAEAHAALRAALAAMPKALTSGSPQVLAEAPQNEMQGSDGALDTTAIKETVTKQDAPQIGSKSLTAWQRIAARILGIR